MIWKSFWLAVQCTECTHVAGMKVEGGTGTGLLGRDRHVVGMEQERRETLI